MFFSCICNKVKLNNNRLTINYASLHLATHTGNSEFLKGPRTNVCFSYQEFYLEKLFEQIRFSFLSSASHCNHLYTNRSREKDSNTRWGGELDHGHSWSRPHHYRDGNAHPTETRVQSHHQKSQPESGTRKFITCLQVSCFCSYLKYSQRTEYGWFSNLQCLTLLTLTLSCYHFHRTNNKFKIQLNMSVSPILSV